MVVLHLCHPVAASLMPGEDKLWTSMHPFAIQRRSSLMARRDILWSFCTFCHSEAVSQMTGVDKLWSSVHPFAIQRRSIPMARKDKLWSFCTVCHLEATSPMTGVDKLWSVCTFCHPEATGLMTCGEPFGPSLFHLLSFRDGGSDDMRRNHMVPHLVFTI